ncbi:hypothetical protein V8G57_13055 [Collimonas sp. H4R21]|uniref:Uncharacterized protein n=1 Tax=Collimonas rhizosphaerae TaxID=3126357 RepID=A0ABU9PWD2_9BURK
MHRTTLALSLLLSVSGVAFGGEKFDETKWQAWVPAGWKILAGATGELNQGGSDDAALVLEEDNPKKRTENPVGNSGGGANLNARRLLVLFHTASGYRKVVETDRFLPSQNQEGDQCTFWSIQDVQVRHKQLHVLLHHEFACGSGTGGDSKFVFRYQDGRFRLIGLDASFAARDTDRTLSVNYLTGKQIFASGNFADEKAEKKSTIPEQERRIYLDKIKPAGCYDLSGYFSENKCK